MDDEKDAQELANMTYGHSKYEAYKVDLSISNPTESFMIFVSPETTLTQEKVNRYTEEIFSVLKKTFGSPPVNAELSKYGFASWRTMNVRSAWTSPVTRDLAPADSSAIGVDPLMRLILTS